MNQWRRLPFVLMALFALCALTLPSLAWACPVTGRNGGATEVCIRAANSASSQQTMSCCVSASKVSAKSASCLGACCKAVPQLPSQDSTKNTALSQAHSDLSGLIAQLSQTTQAIFVTALPVAPLLIESPHAIWGDASVAPLLTQHEFSLFAGRGPPVA